MTNLDMAKLMEMSMDELADLVAVRKAEWKFTEDAFNLRKRMGEVTTKQAERKAKRNMKSVVVMQSNRPPVRQQEYNNGNGVS